MFVRNVTIHVNEDKEIDHITTTTWGGSRTLMWNTETQKFNEIETNQISQLERDATPTTAIPAAALFGVVDVITHKVALIITKSQNVTNTQVDHGEDIFVVQEMVPYVLPRRAISSPTVLSKQDHIESIKFASLVDHYCRQEATGNLYYALDFDATKNAQRRGSCRSQHHSDDEDGHNSSTAPKRHPPTVQTSGPGLGGGSLSSDEKDPLGFWWNYNILNSVVPTGWGVRVFCGYVGSKFVTPDLRVAVISRRSRYRTGTRYHKRGVDSRGHAANTVESEQLLYVEERRVASVVIVRASLPVVWEQPITGKYKPSATLDRAASHNSACGKHFGLLSKYYNGPPCCLNLLSPRDIAPIQEKFHSCLQQVQIDLNVQYVHFDFHKYIKPKDFTNLSMVVPQLEEFMDSIGHYASGTPQHQSGVIRVNCVDCTDRTNIIQTLLTISRAPLQLQSIVSEMPPKEVVDDIVITLRQLWAENGDYIGRQYTGTPALFLDATRTNKRTALGILKDAFYGLKRYGINHFRDGVKDDAMVFVTEEHASSSGDGTTAGGVKPPRVVVAVQSGRRLLAAVLVGWGVSTGMLLFNYYVRTTSVGVEDKAMVGLWSGVGIRELMLSGWSLVWVALASILYVGRRRFLSRPSLIQPRAK